MKAKEFIPASKPRNFVAKNQQTAGAGAHRDKKKEQKQGYEKHKGKGVAEGSEEQVYKVVAVDKSNALKKPTKLNVKASSIEDVFSRLAANDWYALSINGVEVVGGKRLKQGVAEGFMDTLKGAAKEFTRDSLQKKIKQAWENTFWPKHIEPALNRIQIDGQPFRRMVLGEPRVIENDRSKNAILKQYTVNIVFPIDPQQWAGDEIKYLEAQLRDIEDGDWNPKVHGLGLVSFDQPMKSFQYTKGPVPDLVIPVRITSLDINRSLVGEQGVSEGWGQKEFEVDGYTYMTDLDREEDNQKIWHMIKTPDGKTVNVDFTPYAYMTKDDVEFYIKLGMPKRQGRGPLDSEQLQKMAQIKGVAMLDPKMANAGKERKSMEGRRDPDDWDEGNTEPPNNFAIYINGKRWKVFKGRGQFADDYKEIQHYRQLRTWAEKKSAETGKKWTVSVTGEPATE